MATKKISELTEVTTTSLTDVIPIINGGATKKVAVQNLVPMLDLPDQGTDPSVPGSGKHLLYTKSGGVYVRDPGGTIVGPLGAGGGGGTLSPGDVAGLQTWLAAGALIGLSDGDSVLTWPNVVHSGDGFDAIGIGNPIYKTAILNSLPVVRFSGSNYFRFCCPGLQAASMSFFIVFKLASIANGYTGIVGFGSSTDYGGYFIKSNGKSAFYAGSSAPNPYDGTGAITFGITNWNYVGVIAGPTTYSTRRNTSADASGIPWGFGLLPAYGYLGNQLVSSRLLSGDIAEVLIYSRALTSAEVTTIESYLATKYAL